MLPFDIMMAKFKNPKQIERTSLKLLNSKKWELNKMEVS
jgi:hypothetical protein|tara:strand:+ start:700 stop:816 length:117 start_codon:yes stop_codon:yes gene_type:complete